MAYAFNPNTGEANTDGQPKLHKGNLNRPPPTLSPLPPLLLTLELSDIWMFEHLSGTAKMERPETWSGKGEHNSPTTSF